MDKEISKNEIYRLEDKINNITNKLESVNIEVAKLSTQMTMLIETLDNNKNELDKHAKNCQAARDIEEIRAQMWKMSIKLLMSYILLAAAATSVYAAIQKLF